MCILSCPASSIANCKTFTYSADNFWLSYVLVWAVLNWLKSGASVGCGENDGLKCFFDIMKCVEFTEALRNVSLKKCCAAVETARLRRMLPLWSAGCNTIWIAALRWEMLLLPSGWRLKFVVLLTVNTLQSELWLPHFRTDLHDTCLLMGDKCLRTPVNQIPWRSNPRENNYQRRECRFVVISFSTVCVCLYPIFLYTV
jgi:hypothetical protein